MAKKAGLQILIAHGAERVSRPPVGGCHCGDAGSSGSQKTDEVGFVLVGVNDVDPFGLNQSLESTKVVHAKP